MNCIVTAGPTYEPLDEVRRLTNFSTGKLGSELANFLTERGHDVTLLLGSYATYRGKQKAGYVETFTTTADLKSRLQTLAAQPVQAVFHAAAVSDFGFGKAWARNEESGLTERKEGKLSTAQGEFLVELKPTPRIIAELRDWFPQAWLIGWKYEVDGDRSNVLAKAEEQISKNRSDACVANGPAYGEGFGLVTGAGKCEHLPDAMTLYQALARLIES